MSPTPTYLLQHHGFFTRLHFQQYNNCNMSKSNLQYVVQVMLVFPYLLQSQNMFLYINASFTFFLILKWPDIFIFYLDFNFWIFIMYFHLIYCRCGLSKNQRVINVKPQYDITFHNDVITPPINYQKLCTPSRSRSPSTSRQIHKSVHLT